MNLKKVSNTHLVKGEDLNHHGTLYAGRGVEWMVETGFIVASIVMAPFGSAYKKISSNPEKYLKGLEKLFGVESIGKRRLEKSKAYKKLSDIAKFAMDSIVLGIPKAMLTIALIPPILKYDFHMEKGKKKDKD